MFYDMLTCYLQVLQMLIRFFKFPLKVCYTLQHSLVDHKGCFTRGNEDNRQKTKNTVGDASKCLRDIAFSDAINDLNEQYQMAISV